MSASRVVCPWSVVVLALCLTMSVTLAPLRTYGEPVTITVGAVMITLISSVLTAVSIAVALGSLSSARPDIRFDRFNAAVASDCINVGDLIPIHLEVTVSFGAIIDRISANETGKCRVQIWQGKTKIVEEEHTENERAFKQIKWDGKVLATKPGNLILTAKVGVSGQVAGPVRDTWTWVENSWLLVLKVGEPYKVAVKASPPRVVHGAKTELEIEVESNTENYKEADRGGVALLTISVNGRKYEMSVPGAGSAGGTKKTMFHKAPMIHTNSSDPKTMLHFRNITYEIRLSENMEYIQKGRLGDVAVISEPSGSQRQAKVIEFWTTGEEADQLAVCEEVGERFTAQYPEVELHIMAFPEKDLRLHLDTAADAGMLPDIISLPADLVPVFVSNGILDEDASQAVVDSIGKGDFREGPLTIVRNPSTHKYSAVPYHGWVYGIWYRDDLFDASGLYPPVTWTDMNEAAQILPGAVDLLYGLALGTDPNQYYTHQFFELVAMSNDAWPFNVEGEVTMNTPQMIEALRFYTGLSPFALPGQQYWRGAREAYEAGHSGMLFYSTHILDDLVVGSDLLGGGTAEVLEDLALWTGFAPLMMGPNGAASLGELMTLGITEDADPEAKLVVKHFLTEGYMDVLALSPFDRIPVLKRAVDDWKGLSPYFLFYSDETLDQIAEGVDAMQRWLYRPEYGPLQQEVIRSIESNLLIPLAIYNVLEGTMTPESAADWLQEEVEAMLTALQ